MSTIVPSYKVRFRVVTPPTEDAVLFADLKAFLRLTSNDDDVLVQSLLDSATVAAENFTKRKFITQELDGYIDIQSLVSSKFWDGVVEAAQSILVEFSALELPARPLQSVEEISTFSRANVETTYSSSNYMVDAIDPDRAGRIVLNYTAVWPSDLRRANSLRIQWTAGYGDDHESVPTPIQLAIKTAVEYMYIHRGNCSAEDALAESGAVAILKPYVVMVL